MSRVLITGITGFVGSHLADYILATEPGTEIYGLIRWRSPLDNIRHILDKIILLQGDLNDLGSLERTLGISWPDRIYHLAAQSLVPYSYYAPTSTLQTNIIGTSNLLQACLQITPHPLIHICSSSEVYGNPEITPITESAPLQPLSPYGVSKAAMDLMAYQYYQSYGLEVVCTRAFTHTGPRRGDCFVASAFAKQVAEIEADLKPPVIQVGNLNSVRTWCDVRDMVRAYTMIDRCVTGEAYNIGGDTTATVHDVLYMLLELSSAVPVSVREDSRLLRPSDVTMQIPDSTKFREATGWSPQIPLEQTLQDLLDYHRVRVHDYSNYTQ